MAVTYILYNPYSGGPEAKAALKALRASRHDAVAINICRISRYQTFFDGLEPDAAVILCGGDGTLNHFANGVQGIDIKNELYYFPTGIGNDFARDIRQKPFSESPVCINPYLKKLPCVNVKGERHLFLNNVGFGIDGYCCEFGDMLREKNEESERFKPLNYAKIAVRSLLFHYKPRTASVSVDGRPYTFRRVWLATVMNGRFYGGGMMAAPEQDRLRRDGKVSLVVFRGVGKLRALMIFPSIFSGKHTKYKKHMTILEGSSIRVGFDRPTPLQVDGETFPNTTAYSVLSDGTSRFTASERRIIPAV